LTKIPFDRFKRIKYYKESMHKNWPIKYFLFQKNLASKIKEDLLKKKRSIEALKRKINVNFLENNFNELMYLESQILFRNFNWIFLFQKHKR